MPKRALQPGFSLLELLVVVFIIGVLATMYTLSVGVTGGDRELEQEINRLNALLGLAGEEATMQGREIGLHFYPRGYEFSGFDPEEDAWVVLTDDQFFRPRDLPEETVAELEIDGRDVALKEPTERRPQTDEEADDGADDYRPQIFIFSSGDVTPFVLRLRRRFQNDGLTISVNADGTTELAQDEG